MSQMLHFLYSDTKTDTLQYIMLVHVCLYEGADFSDLLGFQQAERQAWLKSCGC